MDPVLIYENEAKAGRSKRCRASQCTASEAGLRKVSGLKKPGKASQKAFVYGTESSVQGVQTLSNPDPEFGRFLSSVLGSFQIVVCFLRAVAVNGTS